MNLDAALHSAAHQIERVMPGVHLVRTYQRQWLRPDLIAGATVVAVLIPQGVAYSELAGTAPVAGLYLALVALLIYALFATSPQLMVGPDSGGAILVAATLLPMAAGDPGRYATLAALLALMVGALLVAAGLARIGFIADFLSKPILIGYINGASLIIVANQSGRLFGINAGGENFFTSLWAVIIRLPSTQWLTFGIGLAIIIFLVALRRFAPRAPAALVVVVLATLASAVFHLDAHGVTVLGKIPSGLPALRFPRMGLTDIGALLPGALGLALVTFADTVLTGRAFASKNDYEFDVAQELIAIGASNIGAGLFQGYPGSTSQSRTAVNDQVGGKTQLTGVFAAILVALFLLFLSPLLQNLPQVALAAIIIVSALSLIDVTSLRRLYRIRPTEAYLDGLTTLGVLIFGILPGLLTAVILDLLVVIWLLARPHDTVLGTVKGIEGYHGIDHSKNNQTEPGLIAYRFDAPLFFGNAEYFLRQARELVRSADPPLEWFLLDAEGIHTLDSTAADTLRSFVIELRQQGIVFAVARANTALRDTLHRTQLDELTDPRHIYPTMTTAVRAYREREARREPEQIPSIAEQADR
ncbi:MAG: SulP family inorganic anion transporter [Ktedonobacterales bacterium]